VEGQTRPAKLGRAVAVGRLLGLYQKTPSNSGNSFIALAVLKKLCFMHAHRAILPASKLGGFDEACGSAG
jgi:hypothetical protein